MSILSDKPLVLTAPPAPPRTEFTDAVNSMGETLRAALAHTSRSKEVEARCQIEQVLGRQLEPLFTLQLVTLLFIQGSEGRELRAALVRLLSMAESPEWTKSLTRVPSAIPRSDDESRFLASADVASVKDFANCGGCLAGMAADRAVEGISSEEAAGQQWAQCAQCRSGTAAWNAR